MSAIMATYDALVAVHNMKTRFHRLVVGDALRIITLHKADDRLRQNHRKFLNHLEVTYYVDNGRRGNQSDSVQYRLREKHRPL